MLKMAKLHLVAIMKNKFLALLCAAALFAGFSLPVRAQQ